MTGNVQAYQLRKLYWWTYKKFFVYLYYLFARYLPVAIADFGWLGISLRRLCAKKLFAYCGDNVIVERGAWFRTGGTLSVGDNSNIGINANINGFVSIGKDVLMGPDVIIMSRNHVFDNPNTPIRKQGYTEHRPVKIGDDVWISARVIILPGVTIGNGSVVAAGSIVTKDIPPYTVVVGVPAVPVKRRNKVIDKETV